MVSTVKTDRTRSHISTRGLEGRSLERRVTIEASLCMIGWGPGFQCMIGWGGRTMLRDPAGGRISADEQVERVADA